MADNTPSFLGSVTPSETEPSFYYGYYSGLNAVEKDGQQQVVSFALPDLYNAGREDERQRAEYDTLKLFGAIDRNDQSFKKQTTVNGLSIDTYVGMKKGQGLTENEPEYAAYNPMGWFSNDTANKETIGEQEKNRMVIAGSGSRGIFGEQNAEFQRLQVLAGQSSAEAYPFDARTSYDWAEKNLAGNFGTWLNAFGKQIGWIDRYGDESTNYFNLEQKLQAQAKNWDSQAAFVATTRFLESHQDLAKYLSASGVDIHQFTRLSKNPFAWTFQVNQAVIQAQTNRRMQIYEENTNWFTRTVDDLYYGIKDPTTVRDLLVTTLASYGTMSIETLLGQAARTGLATQIGASGVLRTGEKLAGRFLTRGLSGGPMTGPIESILFNTTRSIVPSVGHSGFATAAARAGAIAAEAGTWSAVANMAMQKEDYRFKHLALNFGDFTEEFKYDTDQVWNAGLVGGAVGVGFFGTLRGTLGGLGDLSAIRNAKPGEKLAAYSRNVANSLDAYATTPEGRTIFGGRLTQGRGVLFGDFFDNVMVGLDNRNTAGVIVNGKQLHHFQGFTPAVVAKAGFNESKAREIVELWKETTNTVDLPAHYYDPEVLAQTGRTYDDVIATLKGLRDMRAVGLETLKNKKVGLFEVSKPYDRFKEKIVSKTEADLRTRDYRETVATTTREISELETTRKDLIAQRKVLEDRVAGLKGTGYEDALVLVNEWNRLTQKLAALDETAAASGKITGKVTTNINKISKYEQELADIRERKRQNLPVDRKREKFLKAQIQKIQKEQATLDTKKKASTLVAKEEAAKEEIKQETETKEQITDQILAVEKEIENTYGRTVSSIIDDVDTNRRTLKEVNARLEETSSKLTDAQSRNQAARDAISEYTDLVYIDKDAAKVLADLKKLEEKRERLFKRSEEVKAKEKANPREVRRADRRVKQMDAQIKEFKKLHGGDTGIKSLERMSLIEDTINNFRGFGSANTIATLNHIANVESAFNLAARSGVSKETILNTFTGAMLRELNLGSPKDYRENLLPVISFLVGKEKIARLEETLKQFKGLLDDKTKGVSTPEGATIEKAKIWELIKAVITRADRRSSADVGPGPRVIYINSSDVSDVSRINTSDGSVIKLTIDENGIVSIEATYGKLRGSDGKLVLDNARLAEEPTKVKENTVDYFTFAGLLTQMSEGVLTLLKQKEKLQAEVLTTSLKVLQDKMNVIILDAEAISDRGMKALKSVLDAQSDEELVGFIETAEKSAREEFKKAQENKDKEGYEQDHRNVMATFFMLDGLKKYAKERLDKITDEELKKKYKTLIDRLDKEDVSVGAVVRSFYGKLEPKAKAKGKGKEKTKGKGKREKVDIKDIDLTEKEPDEYTSFTDSIFAKALYPTVDNLRLVFGFDRQQAVVARIVMQAVNASVGRGITTNLKIFKTGRINDDIARIFLSRLGGAVRAIIAANAGADIFTVSHEMGHYVEQLFLHPSFEAERKAAGITPEMYEKVMTWLGSTKDAEGNWNITLAMQEKFANGFAIYIQKLLNGDGKAANTGVQFLFNKLGEHVGSLKDKFDTGKEAMDEVGVVMTKEAEEVFATLLSHTAKDSITDIFKMGFEEVFKTLSAEEQDLIGQKVLGEMAWSTHKAKIEAERLKASKKTESVAEGLKAGEAVPKVPKKTAAKKVDEAKTKAAGIDPVTSPEEKAKAVADAKVAEVAAKRTIVDAAISHETAKDLAADVEKAVTTSPAPVPEPVSAKTETPPTVEATLPAKVSDAIDKALDVEPTNAAVKEAEVLNKETNQLVAEAAAKVEKSVAEVETKAEQIIAAAETQPPQIKVQIVEETKATNPRFAFLKPGGVFPELQKLIKEFQEARARNAVIAELISPEQAKTILAASKIRSTPIYESLDERFDVEAKIARIIELIKEGEAKGTNKDNPEVNGIILSSNKEANKLILDTSKETRISVPTLTTLIKGTMDQADVMQKQLEAKHKERIERIERDLKAGKELDSEDRAFIERFKKNLDTKQQAETETVPGFSEERQWLAGAMLQAYAKLLKSNGVSDEAISHLFVKLLESDNFVKALFETEQAKKMGLSSEDPQGLYTFLKENEPTRDDPFYAMLKKEANFFEQREKSKQRGELKKKVKFGLDDEEVVTRTGREVGTTVAGPKGTETNIFDVTQENLRLQSDVVDPSLRVNGSEETLRSQQVLMALVEYVREKGGPVLVEFLAAKIEAIPATKKGQYKSLIQRIWQKREYKKANGSLYNGDDLKALDKKLEAIIDDFEQQLIAAGEKSLAEAIRTVIPAMLERKKKAEAPKPVNTTFSQSVRRLGAIGESSSNRFARQNKLPNVARVISGATPKAGDVITTKQIFDTFPKPFVTPDYNVVKEDKGKTVAGVTSTRAFVTGLAEATANTKYDEYSKLLKLLLKIPNIKQLMDNSAVVYFDEQGRPYNTYIKNTTVLWKNTSVPTMVHELGHQLTQQLVAKELARALKVNVDFIVNIGGNNYLKSLLEARNAKDINPNVRNLIDAYLDYLGSDGLFGHLLNPTDNKYTLEKYLKRREWSTQEYDFIFERLSSLDDWESHKKDVSSRLVSSKRTNGTNEYLRWIKKTPVSKPPGLFRARLKDFPVHAGPRIQEILKDNSAAIERSIQRQLESYGLEVNKDFFIIEHIDKPGDGISEIIMTEEGATKLSGLFVKDGLPETEIRFDVTKDETDFWFEMVHVDIAGEEILIKNNINDADETVMGGLDYGMGNLDEFISESFNNKEHAIKLQNMTTDHSPLSVKEFIYDSVVKIFGLDKNPEATTMLQKVLSNVEELTTTGQQKIYIEDEEAMYTVFSQRLKGKKSAHIERADKFIQELKTAKGRWYILARKLQQALSAEVPDKAEVQRIKDEMDNLLASMSVRRKGLKALGFSEEFSKEDFEIASRILQGLPAYDDLNTKLGIENANRILLTEILDLKDEETKAFYLVAFGSLLGKNPQLAPFIRLLKSAETNPGTLSKTADVLGREVEEDELPDLTKFRDLPTEQRREFLINELYPKIVSSLGDRAGPQNILSKFFEAVPGGSFIARMFQARVGGTVSYGDTANSPFVGLAFIAKIFDPNIDVRNGELTGSFRLPSIEEAEGEAKLIVTASGLPDVINKFVLAKLTEEQLKAINSVAWKNLTKPIDLIPEDTPHRDLIIELIQARRKYNKLAGEYYSRYGNSGMRSDPDSYGTSHRPSSYAEANPDEFVRALTKHETNKFLKSNEMNAATLHAMGWIKIERSKKDGGVDKVVVPKDSPIAKLFKEDELDTKLTWGRAKKRLKISSSEGVKLLSPDVLERYYLALQRVTEDYLPAWREFYKNFDNPTAIFISMRVAKDRLLRLPEGETNNKDLLPKTYFANKASDYSEERLFTHDELIEDEELSKFYSDNVLGLTIEESNSRLFQHVMTKKLSDLFGKVLTMDDLLEMVKELELNYARDIDSSSQRTREGFFRGWEKLKRSWLQKTDRLVHDTSDYDKNFRWLLDSSHGMMMALGGLSAGTKTVASELTRAMLASDRNKSFITQFIPNLINVFKYAGPGGARRRLDLLKMASAIHWSRAVLEDTYAANYEKATTVNDYTGPIFGRRGWFRNLATRWDNLVTANRLETQTGKKVGNVIDSLGWLAGGLLRWSNEMVNVISMHNALRNFGENIGNFRRLAKMLEDYSDELGGDTPKRAEFNKLCKACGIAAEEALDLSRSGLLSVEHIDILHRAFSENESRFTTEGLPDSAKLLQWAEDLPAGERELAKEAVYRMAGYIKTLGRNTNTEPTLLDNRITLDPVARMLRLYTQFGTSNSVQAIGRSRRSGNKALVRFLAGQLLMQTAGGLVMQYLLNGLDDDETIEEIKSTPVAFMLSNLARMPVYGNYGWFFKLLLSLGYNQYAHIAGTEVPRSVGKVDIPDLIGSPFQYRFDSVTKDLERMPSLFTRFMEGRPLSQREKEQVLDSIPLMENMLVAGLIKELLSMDSTPAKPNKIYNYEDIIPFSPSRPQLTKPQSRPQEPIRETVEPQVAQPTPVVQETPRQSLMPPQRTVRPSGKAKILGVSPELADLLEQF